MYLRGAVLVLLRRDHDGLRKGIRDDAEAEAPGHSVAYAKFLENYDRSRYSRV